MKKIQQKLALRKKTIAQLNDHAINSKQLNTTGVLYYQLESADNVATKKMIIIE